MAIALSRTLRECLSRPEFERRYTQTSNQPKMELIEGVVASIINRKLCRSISCFTTGIKFFRTY
ncbi:MAG: hypothetical protein AAFO04_02315 [Cyanobacteria bacterium J06592_8]